MYLKKFAIKRFRCIKDMTIVFNEGVNIIVGENNSGKTAIIDALRLCFSYGDQRRDIYASSSDFYLDKNNPDEVIGEIEFDLHFEINTPNKSGIFYDLLSIKEGGKEELQLHFRIFKDEKQGIERIRYRVWGGDNEGQSITPEVLDLLYHVYMGALRDAVQNLRPIRGSRLGLLYSNIERDTSRREFLASKVTGLLTNDEDWRALIADGEQKVNEHLKETSISGKEQKVNIDFLPMEFNKIVETLRIQMPIFSTIDIKDKLKQKYFELYQNGLGYNNLIFIATILGDLKRRKEVDQDTYIALLIEEPEAHLHPQLQNIFFNYLRNLDKIGFQIFVSSHSPIVTSKAELNSLIVLQVQNYDIFNFSITNSILTMENKKYLQKFLDVTKAQLFFANGVILVEGISEKLLLPILSKILGEEYDLEKKGIEIVNINGVAFDHFGKLFNPDTKDSRLNCRCAILTDDDRNIESDEVSSRAKKARALEQNLLRVELAERTFEVELFKAGNNRDLLLSIFYEMHPRAASNIQENSNIVIYAESFREKLEINKAKAELSHILSLRLEDPEIRASFTVPEYIKRAIQWVVKGE